MSDVVAKVEAASAPTHLATTNNEVRIMHASCIRIPIPASFSLYELLLTSYLVALVLLTFRWQAGCRMWLPR